MGIRIQNFFGNALQNRESLLIFPLELGIFQLLQNALVSCLVQRLRELFVFPFEFLILSLGTGEGCTVLFQLGPHLLHSRNITVQKIGNLGGPFLAVQGSDTGEQLIQLLTLLVESGHLLEDAGRDMVAARLAGALPALQVGVFYDHVFPEFVLPSSQLLFVAHDLLGAQATVCCQGNKGKVHMGCLLVHMHHGGDDRFSGLVPFKEAECFFKIAPDFGRILTLEKFRRGGEQDFYHPDAVCSGAAAGGADLALSFGSVTLRRLNQVAVVFAAGAVNIRVAGVLFFSTLVVGLDVRYLRPFVLGEAYDGILWLAQGRPSFLAI